MRLQALLALAYRDARPQATDAIRLGAHHKLVTKLHRKALDMATLTCVSRFIRPEGASHRTSHTRHTLCRPRFLLAQSAGPINSLHDVEHLFANFRPEDARGQL